MRSSAWAVFACALAFACGGGESDPDSDLLYGPCDNPRCGNGTGASLLRSDGTCICSLMCHRGERCPQPSTGDVEAVCVDLGDVVANGYEGRCDLPCAADETCPDGSQCIGEVCRYRVRCATDDICPDGTRCIDEVCQSRADFDASTR